jgi:NADP-dependent aldehyde dehydrogenase
MKMIGEILRSGEVFHAINPATGERLEPAFAQAGKSDVERACQLAWAAFDSYRQTDPQLRARFLETIADHILALGPMLIDRTVAETGLPIPRIEGERERTVRQLRMFAEGMRRHDWLRSQVDVALPDRLPLARPELRRRDIALGPVAVFGASNFPLAFSVAGGDTASALAAGCPVIVKGHPAHPGTSELVGRAIQKAVAECALPEGVFALLPGPSYALGAALVTDSRVKAVAFTGSRRGGLALMKLVASRSEPIPIYAEMSSINPVFLLPEALSLRAEKIGRDFAGSLTLGVGQFCTNPGLVLALHSSGLDRFLQSAAEALAASKPAPMLTSAIQAAYEESVGLLTRHSKLKTAGCGPRVEGPNQVQPRLFVTDAREFLDDERLSHEVFGPSSLVVRCPDVDTMIAIAEAMEGQLTATLQMDDADMETARRLLPVLERKVGRIIANGWPTGVEVCEAMAHGGPFPATSDSRTTSVGSRAIERFLRPVCYQNLPAQLLPEDIRY